MLKNKKMLNRLKRKLSGNMQDVEDVIQDSFLKYLEKKQKGLVITNGHPRYYFYAILNNVTRTKINKHINKRLNEDPIEDFQLSTFVDPIKSFTNRDINKFADRLPKGQGIIFRKRLELDSHKEVADALNKEYETCKSQWNFALNKFKKEDII